MVLRPETGERPLSRRRLLETSAVVSVGLASAGLMGGPAAAAVRAGVDSADALDIPAITDARVTGIARFGDGLVAVGQVPSGAGAAWVRAGGAAWQRVVGGFGADALPLAVAAYGDRLLAVGASAGRAAGWASRDGAAWRPILADGPAGVLSGVAVAGTDAVAVGQRSDGETAEGAGALVLRSADGSTWDSVDDFGLPDGSESGLTAVTSDRGRWVAASHTVGGAALWQSTDGVAWSPASGPADAGVVISGLTTVDGSLVAVGSTIADTQPRLWIRRDGAWSEVLSIRAGAAANGVLQGAVPLGSDGSILLLGAREGRSVTVATDEL